MAPGRARDESNKGRGYTFERREEEGREEIEECVVSNQLVD